MLQKGPEALLRGKAHKKESSVLGECAGQGEGVHGRAGWEEPSWVARKGERGKGGMGKTRVDEAEMRVETRDGKRQKVYGERPRDGRCGARRRGLLGNGTESVDVAVAVAETEAGAEAGVVEIEKGRADDRSQPGWMPTWVHHADLSASCFVHPASCITPHASCGQLVSL
jgi:hypothetical protein